jgi:hypothetical protein
VWNLDEHCGVSPTHPDFAIFGLQRAATFSLAPLRVHPPRSLLELEISDFPRHDWMVPSRREFLSTVEVPDQHVANGAASRGNAHEVLGMLRFLFSCAISSFAPWPACILACNPDLDLGSDFTRARLSVQGGSTRVCALLLIPLIDVAPLACWLSFFFALHFFFEVSRRLQVARAELVGQRARFGPQGNVHCITSLSANRYML